MSQLAKELSRRNLGRFTSRPNILEYNRVQLQPEEKADPLSESISSAADLDALVALSRESSASSSASSADIHRASNSSHTGSAGLSRASSSSLSAKDVSDVRAVNDPQELSSSPLARHSSVVSPLTSRPPSNAVPGEGEHPGGDEDSGPDEVSSDEDEKLFQYFGVEEEPESPGLHVRTFRVFSVVCAVLGLWLGGLVILYGNNNFTPLRFLALILSFVSAVLAVGIAFLAQGQAKWKSSQTLRSSLMTVLGVIMLFLAVAVTITAARKGFRHDGVVDTSDDFTLWTQDSTVTDAVLFRNRLYAAAGRHSSLAAPQPCGDDKDNTIPAGWSLAPANDNVKMILTGGRYKFGARCVVTTSSNALATGTGLACDTSEGSGCRTRQLITRELKSSDNIVTMSWTTRHTITNTVTHSNYRFATLLNTDVDEASGSTHACHDVPIHLPFGWEVAADDALSLEAARAHLWGTDCLVLATGRGITPVSAEECGVNLIRSSLQSVYLAEQMCSSRVLIRQTTTSAAVTNPINPFAPATDGGSNQTSSTNLPAALSLKGTVLAPPEWEEESTLKDLTSPQSPTASPAVYIALALGEDFETLPAPPAPPAGSTPTPTPTPTPGPVTNTTAGTNTTSGNNTTSLLSDASRRLRLMSDATTRPSFTVKGSLSVKQFPLLLLPNVDVVVKMSVNPTQRTGVLAGQHWDAKYVSSMELTASTGPDVNLFQDLGDDTRARGYLYAKTVGSLAAFPLRPNYNYWHLNVDDEDVGLFTVREPMSNLARKIGGTSAYLAYAHSKYHFSSVDTLPASVNAIVSPSDWDPANELEDLAKDISKINSNNDVKKILTEEFDLDNLLMYLAGALVTGNEAALNSGFYIYRKSGDKEQKWWIVPGFDSRGFRATTAAAEAAYKTGKTHPLFKHVFESYAYSELLLNKIFFLQNELSVQNVFPILTRVDNVLRIALSDPDDWLVRSGKLSATASTSVPAAIAALAADEAAPPVTHTARVVTPAGNSFVELSWTVQKPLFSQSRVRFQVIVSDDLAFTKIVANVSEITTNTYFLNGTQLAPDERYFYRVLSYFTSGPRAGVRSFSTNVYLDSKDNDYPGTDTFKTDTSFTGLPYGTVPSGGSGDSGSSGDGGSGGDGSTETPVEGPFVTRVTNYTVYNGIRYAALDSTSPTNQGKGCQDLALNLPTGWTLAAKSDATIIALLGDRYRYGTKCGIVADGTAIHTEDGIACPLPDGQTTWLYQGTSSIDGDKATYAPISCKDDTARVLIQQNAAPNEQPSFVTALNPSNTITVNNVTYATMLNTEPANATDVTLCQDTAVALPSGWAVAANSTQVLTDAIVGRPWGVECVMMAEGIGYDSTGAKCNDDAQDLISFQSGGINYYALGRCKGAVLIQSTAA